MNRVNNKTEKMVKNVKREAEKLDNPIRRDTISRRLYNGQKISDVFF